MQRTYQGQHYIKRVESQKILLFEAPENCITGPEDLGFRHLTKKICHLL